MFDGEGTSANNFTAGVTSDGTFGTFNWGHLSNASSSPTTITNTWTGGGAEPLLSSWVFR
jgi:hypothetical protein